MDGSNMAWRHGRRNHSVTPLLALHFTVVVSLHISVLGLVATGGSAGGQG